jgi:twinkle protein
MVPSLEQSMVYSRRLKKGAKVCIASLEIKPRRLLFRLTRQASALELPSPEYIEAVHDWYGDKLWLFDLVRTAKSQRLIEVFRYARQRYGVDVFVIDSLMKLDIAEDDYKAQKVFMEQLCDFKNQ